MTVSSHIPLNVYCLETQYNLKLRSVFHLWNIIQSHLAIKSYYILAPTAPGDSSPISPRGPHFFFLFFFLPCSVDSLTRHTFLLPVKPRWRLNVWVAAVRQRGEGREGGDLGHALLLKEPFVAIVSPRLPGVRTLWKVTLISARHAGDPAFLVN